jgi:LCP family protein required for cell wall assembly
MRKNLIIKICAGILLTLIAAAIAFVVFFYGNLQRITVHSSALTPPVSSPTPKPHIDAFNQLEPYSVLLLGYGGGVHEGGKLSDSMMVVSIVPQKQKIFLISIPRDLWIALPINSPAGDQSSYWKINAAYPIGSDDRTYPHKPVAYTGAAGGGELAKYAVQTVTGIPIDRFVAMDFSGFIKSINVLGGIDVKVQNTLDDDLYPIEEQKDNDCGRSADDVKAISATMSATQIENAHMFPCRYEHLHFDVGVIHMDGETALKYARSRHSTNDGGDFNRAARQRNVLLAVKKRVISLAFFTKAIPFISSLSYDLQTDLTPENMQEFLQYKDALSSYQIVGIALTDKNVLAQTRANGQDILAPKAGVDQWNTVSDWLKQQMEN